jgi:hypothetical protein
VLVHAFADAGSTGERLDKDRPRQSTPQPFIETRRGRPAHSTLPAYFAVPGRSTRLEPPTPCPAYPPLELAGIAVDEYGGLYVVVAVHDVTAWLGPTLHEVCRKAQLIAESMSDPANPPAADWHSVLEWLTDAWMVAVTPELPDLRTPTDEETSWLATLASRRHVPNRREA